MALYEFMMIVKQALSDEEAERAMGKVKGLIAKHGGSLVSAENWGKRKLAYPVRKEKKGTYLLFQFSGDGRLPSELEKNCRLDDAVVKFLTVKVERKPPKVSHG